MVKIINFMFYAQKESSGITSQIIMGLAALEPPQDWERRGSRVAPNLAFFIVYFHYFFIYSPNT